MNIKSFVFKQFISLRNKINNIPTLPKNINPQERTVVDIIKNMLSKPDSKLYYDPETFECYIVNGSYYIFIEPRIVKVINSTFGYDIEIQSETEFYLTDLFKKEASKRRKQFKRDTISKIDKSLNTILEDIKK